MDQKQLCANRLNTLHLFELCQDKWKFLHVKSFSYALFTLNLNDKSIPLSTT